VTLGDSVLIAMIGIVASLLGAGVGGWFAYLGAVHVAELTLNHQAALARKAAEN
jgi:hypothetical protein